MQNNENFECKSCSKEPNDKINVARFIDKLDSFFKTNDLEGAKKHIEYWEQMAREYHDSCGLLSIINEELGFYRRTNDKEKALRAVKIANELIEEKDLTNHFSGATIWTNIATTLRCFQETEKGLPLYEKAEKIYLKEEKEKSYEYAALLNNKASALNDLLRYDEAEKAYKKAIKILKEEGEHDGEIAISLISLAHLYFDRDENYELVEETLDKAWEYINSPKQPHDANYAYILSKCAPSLRYFKREMEAEALEEVIQEIYNQ